MFFFPSFEKIAIDFSTEKQTKKVSKFDLNSQILLILKQILL